jgi:hypothetical protein
MGTRTGPDPDDMEQAMTTEADITTSTASDAPERAPRLTGAYAMIDHRLADIDAMCSALWLAVRAADEPLAKAEEPCTALALNGLAKTITSLVSELREEIVTMAREPGWAIAAAVGVGRK